MALNLSTETLARVSARRPWLVVGAWAAVFAISIALISGLLSGALTNEVSFTSNPESKRAETLLEERLRGPQKVNEVVIVRSADKTVDDAAFKAFVEGLYAGVAALGPDIVEQGASFYQTGDESLVSADRRTTILPLVMAGDETQADENIDDVLAVARGANGVDGFQVLVTGGASINKDFTEVSESDLQTGEAFGIPIALVVLVIVFGAITAALVPLVLGVFSIVVAVGLTALLGQGFEVSFFVTNVITMMGLAVGIDYSLFVVSRYREERSRGREKLDAIASTGATASRAVFFSGMTVVFALLGMLIVPTTIFRSLAAGAIIVVIVSVLVSLTLLPALLGILGDKVNALRLPFTGRRVVHEGGSSPNGFWDRVTRTVMRYPVVSLVATAALLIALAVPYLDIQTGSAGVSTLPDDRQSKEGFLILEKEFSFGLVSPAEIAIDGDVNGPEVQQSIQRLEISLKEDPSFGQGTLQVNDSGDLALFSVPVAGDPSGDETIAAIERLRSQHIARAFAGTDAEVLVGGITAKDMDYFHVTDSYTPIVVAFVLGLSFLLLTVVFRSIVVPLKAIVMNLLSVGAAYGLLVLVFQKGVGNEIFGFQQVDIIEAWVPLWTFSILFGLSMDYHVFLLSRIRERFLQTHDNSESVAFGLRTTAGIITGAALIMAGVFGGIAAGQLVMFQQMGFGLAVAVLLDATIVRSILVPASMRLLGDWNWYLPSVLRWLPEMRMERKESAAASSEAS
jgi:RND superfamily putative drug exporter